ncbi:FMN-binding protein MioC [Alteromonas halophila]|uniref:Flavodoxin-like domain-containing protein n=1 Tax=Alteromonas halophila TaxID=516698 RepID=A0A918JRM6_9ALTE|nr:FMN-binding protein MioC [Alteromonas halophila]GGW96439.1 hypothetical protein GCM10007391_33200 [Alteromonas halophila]
MSTRYSIIVGSMLGAAEYVADALAEVIREHNGQAEIHLEPALDDIPKDSVWVVCTSTHGAGDLPDNIQPFATSLENTDLSDISAYIVGLGDSSYDTFCFGAETMEGLLRKGGATLLEKPLHIDVLHHPIPEDEAVNWFRSRIRS